MVFRVVILAPSIFFTFIILISKRWYHTFFISFVLIFIFSVFHHLYILVASVIIEERQYFFRKRFFKNSLVAIDGLKEFFSFLQKFLISNFPAFDGIRFRKVFVNYFGLTQLNLKYFIHISEGKILNFPILQLIQINLCFPHNFSLMLVFHSMNYHNNLSSIKLTQFSFWLYFIFIVTPSQRQLLMNGAFMAFLATRAQLSPEQNSTSKFTNLSSLGQLKILDRFNLISLSSIEFNNNMINP